MTTPTQVRLAPTGHTVLFTHAALWGAAAIAAVGNDDIRIGWTGGLTPAAVVYGIDGPALAGAVHRRAAAAGEPGHWIGAALPHEPDRALFSPRIKLLPDAPSWQAMHTARQSHLDALHGAADLLDLQLLAALGQPSSWHTFKGEPRQDHGASRLEMQPRNQGSEFVGTRLRALAAAVANRELKQVEAGLTGAQMTDEVGKGNAESRSAANLRPPGLTDNALAWTAMWGLASTPVAHLVSQMSRTAAHIPFDKNSGLGPEVRAGHVVAPMWSGRWTMSRLRTILASQALSTVAQAHLQPGPMSAAAQRDQEWLLEHGVQGLVLLPIHTFGSTSSPERRAVPGTLVRLGASAV